MNPTRVCELMVGLGDVEVLGVVDGAGGPLVLHVRIRGRRACEGCGGRRVADPFHVIGTANDCVDEVRRRTHNDTLGHRGRNGDGLYRVQRLLLAAHERQRP